jgi:predicted small lipoprotein YifL
MRNQLIPALLLTSALALTACGNGGTTTAPDAAPVTASPAEMETAAADPTAADPAATTTLPPRAARW